MEAVSLGFAVVSDRGEDGVLKFEDINGRQIWERTAACNAAEILADVYPQHHCIVVELTTVYEPVAGEVR